MAIIDLIKQKAKQHIQTIILPEADDVRILEAAQIVTKEKVAKIILLGDPKEITQIANINNIDITDIEIVNPKTDERFPILVDKFFELRKHKGISIEEAKNLLENNYLYYGCMLVREGYADGQVSGATHSSADTIRPALQIIKTGPDTKIASSFFLITVPNCEYGEQGTFVFSDCGMIQSPTSEELVEIAKTSAETFKLLVGKEPIIAFLSHSTFGTSKCSDTEKVSQAVCLFKEKYPEYNADGEMQLDTAIVPNVAQSKAPHSKVAGKANVLIFPNLDAGNIGYKIAERLAKAEAYGPITQGLLKPVNDLSRGSTVNDIVGSIAITALQSIYKK